MRPVQLDIAGFASFRDPAVVDFTDADYFALVGPTGSGKSTVIDAMTFALYGSVPRWGRRNAIADALAPTSNRCTVRLVFDHSGARYVVAREVRRSGASITQRNVILERLPEQHGIGADGEPGEVIAGDLKEVNDRIEQLLGLSFEDFCKCIVLPQGQFADFLKATPKDRQTILLKLLGAEQYETIGRAAAQRSAVAAQTVNVLTAQLGDLADATLEAEQAARKKETQLAALAIAVDDQLPAVAAAADRVETATTEHALLTAERDLLAAVRTPAAVADLQDRLDRADAALSAAQVAERSAEQADQAARVALADAPPRHQLETLLDRYREHADLSARQPDLSETATTAAERQAALSVTVGRLGQAVDAARTARTSAQQDAATAVGQHERLQQRRAQLATAVAPPGLVELEQLSNAARLAATRARAARASAEIADQQARQVLRLAPPRGPLEQAGRDLAEQAALNDQVKALTRTLSSVETEVTTATAAVTAARGQLTDARERLEQTRSADLAAALRPQLVAGHSCPVCDQTVLTLPPALDTTDLTDAAAAVRRVEAELEAAQQQQAAVAGTVSALTADIAAAERRLSQLHSALQGRPTEPAAIDTELARLDALTTDADDQLQVLLGTREAEQRADSALADAERHSNAALAQLRNVHAPLISVGAPELDDTDLAGAWTTLTAWATTETRQLDGDLLPAAARRLAAANGQLDDTQTTLDRIEHELRTVQAEHTAATAAAASAAESHRILIDRLSQLDALLAGATGQPQTAAALVERERLENTAQTTDLALAAVRTTRAAAAAGQERRRADAAAARQALRATRDSLVGIGAPALDDENVAAAWAMLTAWTAAQAQTRAGLLVAARTRIEQATVDHRAARDRLWTLVAASDVDLSADITPAAVPAVVATALERARGTAQRIAADRVRAATLTGDIDAAEERHQVADLLADLLRSNKFPRWLAAAALDTLVIDASAALLELSGGQFDLTHHNGEFMVIDHADADSTRSVRTLSGGETFQASLALALALAEQMSALAAEGAAQLDSIFLDEGFGTLDPDSLETVADTLETLAQGDRMVGVITHVAALADRAPVRFAVHRDNLTSTVVREGA